MEIDNKTPINNNIASNEKLPSKDNAEIERSLVEIISEETRQIWNKKIPGTQMEKFRNIIQEKYGVKFENYWDFHEWTIKNYPQFWEEVWNFYGVICSKSYDQPCKRTGDRVIDVEWFPGAEGNFTENLLRYRDDGVALICADEDGNELKVTFAQMYDEVRLYAAAFKKMGLQKGDRVACYMSNRTEAVYAMLAAASIGAVFGGVLPFYGAKPVAAILDLIKPKFLFTVDRFKYNKVENNILERLPEIVNDQECIEKVIIVPTNEGSKLKDISSVNNSCFLDEFLEEGKYPDGSIPELVFEQFSFNQPVFIDFTSGTTGQPKGIVHTTAAILPFFRDFGLHFNHDRNSVVLCMTPVGWGAWNFNLGNLAIGGSILLFDGLPCFLSKTAFWDIVDKYKVSFFMIATSAIDAFEKQGIVPAPDCKLEHLKLISPIASVFKLQNVDFILEKVKPDVFFGSLYGSVEIIGVFSGVDFNSPLYSGEIQCPALGVDIRIFDKEGNSVVGKPGELLIVTPNPAFPVYIWNDEDGTKMENTYFSKFPNVWAQGDEAWIDPKTRGMVIIGRSDNTIKQYGGRFVSEEIYWAVYNIEEIADSICVSQTKFGEDDRVVLFVKMKNGHVLDKDLISKIQQTIRRELAHFCVPRVILQVEDIPYNLNGKRMESVVKKIVNTNVIPEVNNIRNPECLPQFWNIPELQEF